MTDEEKVLRRLKKHLEDAGIDPGSGGTVRYLRECEHCGEAVPFSWAEVQNREGTCTLCGETTSVEP